MSTALLLAASSAIRSLSPEIEHHWVADEVYHKRHVLAAGTSVPKHLHEYDHASALVRGRIRLTVDGETRELTAPAMLHIAAGKQHHVECLTQVVWHCIHIDPTDDVVSGVPA